MRLSAVWLRVREWSRRSGRRAALFAIAIGVAAGAVMSVAAGARRVASAPDRLTAALGGEPDLVFQQTAGAPLTEAVRSLPGVVDSQGATFTAAFPVTDRFAEHASATAPFTGTAGALGALVVKGRETDPAAPDEFVANRPWVELAGAEVGDRFEIKAYDFEQLNQQAFEFGGSPAIGSFEATLVGITESPGDFENPAPLILYSSGMLTARPAIGVVASFLLVDLAPGTDPGDVVDAARALPGGESLQPTPDSKFVSTDVRRAVRFVSVSLWLVAAIAGGALAVVIGLLATQVLGLRRQDREAFRVLGWQRRDFVLAALVEAAAMATMAAATATVVSIGASGLFPFATVRMLEPDPGIRLDPVVLAAGSLAILAAWVLPAVANERWPRRERGLRSARAAGGAMARPLWSLPVSLGVRFALEPPAGRRSAWPTLAAGVIGCAGCVAAITVGLSIERLIDQPAQRGVNVDGIFGNQYVPEFEDIVTPARSDPNVRDLAAATTGTLSIDGVVVNVLAFETVRGSYDPTTLDGRAPRGPDEIAIGREVLRPLDKDLGDSVVTAGPSGTKRELTIVGVVITPYVGGGGAAVTYEAYELLVPDATRNLLLVRFAEDADPDAAERFAEVTDTGVENDLLTVPTSVGAVERVLPMPYLLAAILSTLGAISLMQALAASVRDRRRDYGVMRALGAVGGQLRALLHWQATTVAAVVLILGVPLGLLGGRLVFGAIADRVGLAPDPLMAWTLLPLLVVIVAVVTNVAALAPGIGARRASARDLVAER